MRDKFTQKVDDLYLNEFLATASTDPKALVLSAYLEERKRWDDKILKLTNYKFSLIQKLDILDDKLALAKDELALYINEVKNEKGLIMELLKSLNIPTRKIAMLKLKLKAVKRLDKQIFELESEFNSILTKIEKLLLSPPDMDRYELAMLGNDLFKPR